MSVFDSIAHVARRVRAFLHRDELGAQLDEELEFHTAMIAEREAARGADTREASHRAWRRVGNRTRIREDARDAWSFAILERTTQDVRYAVRGLRARPVFAATVVVTLALGIGANTAVFSLVNWLLFQPVPGVTEPGRLVTVRFGSQFGDGRAWFPTSYPVLEDLRRDTRTLRDIAGHMREDVHVSTGPLGSAWRARAEIVSPNYFSVLGVRSTIGRTFSADDGVGIGSHNEVVISDRAWKTAFASDAGIVGKTLLVNGQLTVVIGVMPPGFLGPRLPGDTDYWVSVSMLPRLFPDYPSNVLQNRRATFLFELLGRMRDDAVLPLVQRELADTYRRITTASTDKASSGLPVEPVAFAGLGLPEWEHERVRGIVTLLGAVVGLVLLTACANTANLLLARGIGRRHEMAVRRAIGAGRGRLVRQHLTECALLAALGGTAAVALAWLIARASATVRIVPTMPPLGTVPLDWRVVLFAFACTIVSAGLFGIAPAFLSTRDDPQTALRAGAYRTPSGTRVRAGLMALQMALSLILLVGAGLFVRTLSNLRGVKLGVDVSPVVTVGLDLQAQGYRIDRTRSFYNDLMAQLARERGVGAVAIVWLPLFGEGAADAGLWRADADSSSSVDARLNKVTPEFFKVGGVRILEGRTFRSEEILSLDSTRAKPVIVSASLAKRLFGAVDPIGRRLRRRWEGATEFEVVGVAADARTVRVASEPEPYVYEPLGQGFVPKRTTLMVRSVANASDATAAVRRVVRSLDPTMPVFDVRTLGAQIDRQLFEQIAVARLTSMFALIAVLLAAVGLYGLLSFYVSERSREFGIRAALGGRTRALVTPVMRSVAALGGVGILCGVAIAAGATKLVQNRLYGVRPLDVPTFAAAAVLLAGVALCAAAIPAWRAARVDPLVALRRE